MEGQEQFQSAGFPLTRGRRREEVRVEEGGEGDCDSGPYVIGLTAAPTKEAPRKTAHL